LDIQLICELIRIKISAPISRITQANEETGERDTFLSYFLSDEGKSSMEKVTMISQRATNNMIDINN
jgi:hypothetical protein